MLPQVDVQVEAMLAENCCVAPSRTVGVCGLMEYVFETVSTAVAV